MEKRDSSQRQRAQIYLLPDFSPLQRHQVFTLIIIKFRSYVSNNYEEIKQKNPETPFIVRECTNAQPSVMARYDFGIEKRVYVHNLEESAIDKVV